MARLLVVDDDDDILQLVWTQMRARGHQVLGAASGPEALEAVELWGPPQVAVLDVAMPAIFLSARVDAHTVEAALARGSSWPSRKPSSGHRAPDARGVAASPGGVGRGHLRRPGRARP